MRQRRTSTEPSQSYSSGPQQPTQSPSAAPIRLIEFTPWLVRQNGPTGTRSAIYFIRGVERRIWLGRISARSVWNEEHVGKRMDVIAAKIRECQPAMSCDTVPGAAAFTWQVPGNSRWPIKKRSWPPKRYGDAIRITHPRDRSAARVYRPFVRLGMDRCKRAPLNG